MDNKIVGVYLAPEFKVIDIELMQVIASSLDNVGIEPSPEIDDPVYW